MHGPVLPATGLFCMLYSNHVRLCKKYAPFCKDISFYFGYNETNTYEEVFP